MIKYICFIDKSLNLSHFPYYLFTFKPSQISLFLINHYKISNETAEF